MRASPVDSWLRISPPPKPHCFLTEQPESCYRFLYLIKCPRERGLAPGARPLCAFGAGVSPWGRSELRPMSRDLDAERHGQNIASGGGAQAPRCRGLRSRVPAECGVRWVLPSRLPSTQAEPSSRGPGRQGRSSSGALHLDALNHARSTVCGSTADGMGAGVSGRLVAA